MTDNSLSTCTTPEFKISYENSSWNLTKDCIASYSGLAIELMDSSETITTFVYPISVEEWKGGNNLTDEDLTSMFGRMPKDGDWVVVDSIDHTEVHDSLDLACVAAQRHTDIYVPAILKFNLNSIGG